MSRWTSLKSEIEMNWISNRPLNEIDPQWAWSAWSPSDQEKWDVERISRLYRRAAFGASQAKLKQAQEGTVEQAVAGLLESPKEQEEFDRDSQAIAQTVKATGEVKNLTTWWLHRMLTSPHSFREKMTLFWHGHFATGAEKVLDVELMYEQNELLRKYALGDFRQMVHGISKDPAMLIYLDSVTNRKAHANENYARELMELFCLGEGNYTEADVQQLARCFTGWEIRRKQFRFNSYQHDSGKKNLLGKSGIESGEEAIDQVLASPDLPYFIAKKLFKFFVCDEPTPSRAMLEPLADRLSKDQLNLRGGLEMLLRSNILLSDWSVGKKIRSPIDLAIGLLTTLDGSANLEKLSNRLREVGQAVFFPPNVKGWDGGRAWINSSTLVGRANLVHQLIRDENTRFSDGTLNTMVTKIGGGSLKKFVEWLEKSFFATPLSTEKKESILARFEGKSGEGSVRELISLLAALPEIQLS